MITCDSRECSDQITYSSKDVGSLDSEVIAPPNRLARLFVLSFAIESNNDFKSSITLIGIGCNVPFRILESMYNIPRFAEGWILIRISA